jgi:hypothetical protein
MGSKDMEQVVYHCNMFDLVFEEHSDGDIIHVSFPFLLSIFLVPWFEDGIYEMLEGCWQITHPKEHD